LQQEQKLRHQCKRRELRLLAHPCPCHHVAYLARCLSSQPNHLCHVTERQHKYSCLPSMLFLFYVCSARAPSKQVTLLLVLTFNRKWKHFSSCKPLHGMSGALTRRWLLFPAAGAARGQLGWCLSRLRRKKCCATHHHHSPPSTLTLCNPLQRLLGVEAVTSMQDAPPSTTVSCMSCP